jgi:hypothetical protein
MYMALSPHAIRVRAASLDEAIAAARLGGFEGVEINIRELADLVEAQGAEMEVVGQAPAEAFELLRLRKQIVVPSKLADVPPELADVRHIFPTGVDQRSQGVDVAALRCLKVLEPLLKTLPVASFAPSDHQHVGLSAGRVLHDYLEAAFLS